ncbi:MAG: type II secretion system protein GspG, partial [Phycisphaerales bacterium]|nr:type II secretion system protein GspG [Phycisphaerales bacterium]
MTLEIAARTFIPAADKTGPTVHLVGAVHVGDKPFYAALQEMLDRCDLVLFEGVKPPGAGAFDAELDDAGKVKATKARVDFLLLVAEQERSRTGRLPESLAQAVEDAGKRWKTMIASSLTDAWGRPVQYALVPADAPAAEQHAVVTSVGPDGVSQEGRGDDIRAEGKGAPKRAAAKDPGLQSKLADALGLTFQLDAMDSSKPNWRSSDMSIDQLQARFRAAGIEGDRLFSMLDGSSFVGQIASLALGIVKASPQLSGMVKVMMVDMLGSEDALAAGPADLKKMMAVILVDRNDVVLNDLRGVIEREQRKDVAVFYGAGHLPDMEMKLRRDFGYTPAQERWTPAITVDPKAAGMSAKQVQAMRQSMKRQMTAAAQAEQKRAERAKAREKAKEEGEGQ